MHRAEKYRRRTAECLQLAGTGAFRDFGDRILLIEMAALWLRLAEHAEAQRLKSASSRDHSPRSAPIILEYCTRSAPGSPRNAAQPFSLALEMAVARALEPCCTPRLDVFRGTQDEG